MSVDGPNPNTGSRRRERWNAWLTALLLFAVVVQANRLASRRLAVRQDFSQDQLFALSPATRAILGRVEDRLQVKAYFTQRVEAGNVALLKARLEGQLEELVTLGEGRVEVDVQDPSVYSAALEEARSYGVRPLATRASSGSRHSSQDVWLGAVLRYRGRSEVLPTLNPWTLESEFVQAVHRLLSDRRKTIGWTGEPFEQPEGLARFGSFQLARAGLGRRYEVVEVPTSDLESGEPVPAELDVLLVVRPTNWHPRAVFALDQFLQRGGRALILPDRVHPDLYGRSRAQQTGETLHPTGLEALLRSWGAPLAPQHAWDNGSAVERLRLASVQGPEGPVPQFPTVADPACPRLTGPESLHPTFPPTARLGALDLWWAHPLGAGDPPQGMMREDFLHTSATAHVTDVPLEVAVLEPSQVQDLNASLNFRTGQFHAGDRLVLGTRLEGRFPSPFQRGAPAPYDALTGTPGVATGTTAEPVLSAAADARVLIVGDADWIRDPDTRNQQFRSILPGLEGAGSILFENLVDWLAAEDELLSVRGKQPRSRPIVDLYQEELAGKGLQEGDDLRNEDELRRRRALRDQALARAEARRWWAMGLPLVVVLLALIGVGLGWTLLSRRSTT